MTSERNESLPVDTADLGRVEARPTPHAPEATPLSPGPSGSVFNPVVWAEFRRWRARPITYLGIVLLILGTISYLVMAANTPFVTRLIMMGVLPAAINIVNPWVIFVERLMNLLIRPSTILPLLMVWRALVSFREDGMYRPLRPTFLSPSAFLWGVIAIPCLVSVVLLVGYTGTMLAPRIIQGYHALPAESRQVHPYWIILGVLFEGSLNGAMVAFVGLYFGLRSKARLAGLLPVLLAVIALQSAQASLFLVESRLNQFLFGLPFRLDAVLGAWPDWIRPDELLADRDRFERVRAIVREVTPYVQRLFHYAVAGTPKILICWYLWTRCVRVLHRDEEE